MDRQNTDVISQMYVREICPPITRSCMSIAVSRHGCGILGSADIGYHVVRNGSGTRCAGDLIEVFCLLGVHYDLKASR